MDTPGWKWYIRLTKNSMKLSRMSKIFYSKIKLKGNKYKCGIKVPTYYEESLELDNNNNNTLWQNMVNKDMGKSRILRTLRL